MQITTKLKCSAPRVLILLLITISLFTSSCRNMFTELADRESNAALTYQAKRLIDARLYTEAIDLLEDELSGTYFARRDIQVLLASAYVGRCGLDYLVLADAIINNTAGLTPMEIALNHMKSSTSEADCLEAEDIMRAVSPATNGIMSDDINDAFFMAFISLAKLGAVLARVGDADNNGTIDGGFDACAVAAADSRQLGSALTLLYNNIISSGSDLATAMGQMNTFCDNAMVVAAGTCAKTDPTTFSAAELKLLNGIVDYDQFGVGADAAYTPCP